MRPGVAGLGAGWRKYPPRGPPGPCGAFVGRFPVGQFYQERQDSRCRIFKQEERPGAAGRHSGHFTSPGNAGRFKEFRDLQGQKRYGAGFEALAPGYGAVDSEYPSFTRDYTVPEQGAIDERGLALYKIKSQTKKK